MGDGREEEWLGRGASSPVIYSQASALPDWHRGQGRKYVGRESYCNQPNGRHERHCARAGVAEGRDEKFILKEDGD